MKRLFLICLLAVAGMAGAWAYNFEVDDIYYNITDEAALEVEVTYRSYSSASYSGEVVIPDSVSYYGGTYRVTGIGSYAFEDCSSLTSVTIPDEVKNIRWGAFRNCSSLTSVNIPDGVTSIESSAFSGCSSLTSVNIPDGVTSIGSSAFEGCSSITSVTIPDRVASIEYGTFEGCSSLASVTIGNGVTSIGNSTFNGCSSLTSVTIPDGVTSIGSQAFKGCNSLSSVVWNAVNCEDFYSKDTPFYCDTYSNVNFDLRGQITAFIFGDSVKHVPAYLCAGMEKLDSITIPDGVTSIGSGTFSGCSSLTSVTIPDGVTSIGSHTFRGCDNLTSVVWNAIRCDDFTNNDTPFYYFAPMGDDSNFDLRDQINSFTFGDKVEHIPAYLCDGMENLVSMTIPDRVTSIGESAFSYCDKLTAVVVGAANPAYSSLDGVLFDKEGTTLVAYPAGKQGEYTIPDIVTSIRSYAFGGCDMLTTVTISEGIKSLGNRAFAGCDRLTSVVWNAINCEDFTSNDTPFYYNYYYSSFDLREQIRSFAFGDKVTHIPACLCAGMENLPSITIPDKVESIGNSAFEGCSNLTSVYYTGDIGKWCGISFEGSSSNPLCNASNLYIDNQLVTNAEIPHEVTEIKDYVFSGCNGLTSVTIGDGVKSIGNSAFSGCSSLTSVTIGDGVKDIGNSAFSGCSSLTSVTIDDGVKSIGNFAFSGCNGLTSVTFGEGVTSIGDCVFWGCDNLSTVVWNVANYEVLTSDRTPFYQLERYYYDIRRQITSFSFGEHVKHIPAWLCAGMTELTSVTIGEEVESIGSSAFEGCDNLLTLLYNGTLESWCEIDFSTITSNPISYAKRTFINQQQLAGDLILPEGVTEVKDYAFYGCKELTSVVIPDETMLIGDSTFCDCSGLTSVVIGEGMANIGESAFLNCATVKDVYCYAPIPPELSGNPFVSLSEGANLYVPCGAEFDYSTTGYWASFGNIIGVEHQVLVLTNDASKGTVALTRPVLCETSEAVIQATPAEGFRFVQWNDGNTDNPRTVTVTSDTTFAGLFASSSTCYVRISANDPTMGSVVGSGGYEQGTTATIAAVPAEGYRFMQWSDGNTDNPRTLTVTEDISLTAEFASATESGIDDITRQLTVTTDHRNILVYGASDSTVSVYTVQGTCLYRGTAETEPAVISVPSAGMYVVMVGDKMVKVVVR